MSNYLNSTLNVIEINRQQTGYYKKLKLPEIEHGNEIENFTIGSLIKHHHNINHFYYYIAEIVGSYSENGFWYYVVKNKECREFDSNKLISKYTKKEFFNTIRTCEIIA